MTEFPAEELEAVFGEARPVEAAPIEEGPPAITVALWRVRSGDQSAVLKHMRHSLKRSPHAGRRPRSPARLVAGPQTLCHNDLHPANLVGADATVLIDWAYCGLGALGLDAGVLVADAFADGFIEAVRAEELAHAVWEGYRAGLGGAQENEARYAFLAGTALRYSWIARGLADPDLDPDKRRRWVPVTAMLDRWAEEAARLPSPA